MDVVKYMVENPNRRALLTLGALATYGGMG